MNVLVVAAHPDDEVLGAGGAIFSHTRRGDRVHVLVLSDGIVSRRDVDADEQARVATRRRVAAEKAAEVLGVTSLDIRAFRDNHFIIESRRDVTTAIEEAVLDVQPDVVYTHFHGDLSHDHQVTADGVAVAARPAPGRTVASVIAFEVRSSTDWSLDRHGAFVPNMWAPLDEEAVAAKMAALDVYTEEMRQWPHSRSVQAVTALLAHRGAEIGVTAAEAFAACRIIGDLAPTEGT